ncbi:hypothetical protein OROHE_025259 [Orobanche hederae]
MEVGWFGYLCGLNLSCVLLSFGRCGFRLDWAILRCWPQGQLGPGRGYCDRRLSRLGLSDICTTATRFW